MGELDTAGSDSAAALNIMKPMMPTWINSSLHRGSLPGVLATFGYEMEQPRGSDSMMRGGIATSAGIRLTSSCPGFASAHSPEQPSSSGVVAMQGKSVICKRREGCKQERNINVWN
jgi:hypothetical protein